MTPGAHPATAPLVVAVDVSTTAAKAVAFAPDGTTVASARTALERTSPASGWQEQNADDWWSSTTGALRQLMAMVNPARIRGLAITHQRESFVLLDQCGDPIRPAILWLDVRATAEIRRLGTPAIHATSGKPPSTTPAIYKLAWLAEHEPDAMRRTATVADVHGYLVARLTGRRATSWASADPLGIVDMRTFGYDPDLVTMAGLRPDQLPGLVAPGSVIGEVTSGAGDATGLPRGLPVIAGAGDGQCAGLGAAVTRPGTAYLNLGTGLTLGTHADRYSFDRAYRTLSSPLAGCWTLEALLASGVLSLAWFRDRVVRDLAPGAEARLEALAIEIPPGSDGLLFLPYLTSAETPYWDPLARGAWVGLRDEHTVGHMYRAVLEGIAFEERFVLDLIEGSTGVPITTIRAMGGGSRSRLWLRILSDALEREINVGGEVETTALGAGVLAAAGVSMEGESDIARTAERMSGQWRASVDPAPRPAAYARAQSVYERLYPALSGLFPDLADIAAAPR